LEGTEFCRSIALFYYNKSGKVIFTANVVINSDSGQIKNNYEAKNQAFESNFF